MTMRSMSYLIVKRAKGLKSLKQNHSIVAWFRSFFSYRTRHDAQESNKVETTMPESAEQAAALLHVQYGIGERIASTGGRAKHQLGDV